ncbi:FG-GAP-like repeat-containing protein [Leucothrix pacifica]|uniref:FG-GAP-like repeat-containing protein n=1 Tax=Leucothrix pacifica TaxID=1247513 RepID=UPI0015E82C92|nr:FG-GAP-like repeat-containing protein [Leucothrix pacifica]
MLTAAPLDVVSVNVVKMPSGYPVIWKKKNVYGFPENADVSDSSFVTLCSSGSGCHNDALDLGALYFHQVFVEGYGLVVAYYDANGKLVGTKLGGLEGASGGGTTPPPIDSYYDSANQTVGYLEGSFSSNSSGAAIYEIPIAIPPGSAGVQPEVSLQYNSQGGSSIAGLGWSVTGLSTISRCAKTVAQNGIKDGINFNTSDVFCLDGQQLVKVGGGAYGGNGTTYKTEIDNYSHITSRDLDGDNFPESFEIRTKAGEIISYGTSHLSQVHQLSSDAELEYDKRILSWNISRRTDRTNNYIDYTYSATTNVSNNSNNFSIKKIQYTGNTSLNQLPFASVIFHYKDTPSATSASASNLILSYVNGYAFHKDKILDKVTVELQNTTLRTYQLSYFDQEGEHQEAIASRVKSIQECGVTNCLPATWFIWDGNHASNTDFVGGTATAPASGVSGNLAQRPEGNGIVTPDESVFLPEEAGEATFKSSALLNQLAADESSFYSRLVGDVNGDGRSDVVMVRTNNAGGVRIALSNGHGFVIEDTGDVTDSNSITHAHEPYFLADVNGDGLSDLVHFAKNRVKVSLSEYVNGQYTLQPETNWTSNTAYTYDGGHRSLDEHPRFLQDMNGDGLADIVSIYSTGVFVALSDGTKFIPHTAKWSSNLISFPTDKLENFAVLDLTGDGLPEVARLHHPNVSNRTHISFLRNSNDFNNGSANLTSWTFDSTDPSGSKIRFGDFNGDGLADIASYDKSTNHSNVADHDVYIRYSTGKGFTSKVKAINYYGRASSDRRESIVDVNGDGLSDFVRFDSFGVRVDLNRGNHFTKSNWSSDFKSGTRFSHAYSMRSFGDFNGDGLVDVIGIDNDGITIGENKIEPQRIARIITGGYVEPTATSASNGLNRSIEILYDKLTATNNDYSSAIYTREHNSGGALGVTSPVNIVGRQFGLFVVSAHYSSNGSIGNNRGRLAGMSYTYKGLQVDTKGRGLQGFAERTAVDTNKKISTTEYYYQNYPLTGSSRGTLTKLPSGALLSKNVNKRVYSVNTGSNSKKYYRPWVNYSEDTSYKLATSEAYKVAKTAYSDPNSCGDSPVITNTITNPVAGVLVNRKTTTNVFPSNSDCYLASRLTSSSVKHERGSFPAKTKTSSFTYYSTSGQLRAETIEPGDANQLVTTYEYTAHGNVKLKTITGKGLVGSESTIGSRFTKTSRYDQYGRFPEVVENALGHKTTTLYDERFGTVKSHTDINNLTSESRVNEFGQPYVSTSPNGNSSHTIYSWCNQTINQMDVRYCTTTETRDGGYVKKYFDQLDRVVRTETRGLGEGGSKTIYVDKVYDLTSGRLWWESLPYYSGSSQHKIVYNYDILDRPNSIRQPGLPAATVAYDGLTVSKTNAKGQTTTTLKAADGKTEIVTDPLGNQVKYRYYADGNLQSTEVVASTQGGQSTPDKNNIKTIFAYDSLGRKRRMNDPDMGIWDYRYNAAGQLVYQRDANLKVTRIEYDVLGRMKKRTEDGSIQEWEYDNASGKGVGKLRKVTNTNGYQKRIGYTDYGQVASVEERLPNEHGSIGLSAGVTAYTTSNTYDAFGRLDTVTYPTANPLNPVIARHHYESGILNKVSDVTSGKVYWEAKQANASGQITEQKLGNGVTTNRSYDVLGRLDEVLSGNGSSSSNLQYLRYNFDSVGNLEDRDDLNGKVRERFVYDDLNRFNGSFIQHNYNTNANEFGGESIRYDGHGNITLKGGNNYYKYLGSGAHAVSSIGGSALSYDANGNMLTGKGRTIYYTAFNKPSAIGKGGQWSYFTYGTERQRVLKKTDTQKTWYVGGLYERVRKNSGSETHKFYIRAGGQTVAYINQHKSASGAWVGDNTYYLLSDHLGSTDVVTDSSGQVVHRLSFDVWGKRRQSNWYSLSGSQLANTLASLEQTALTLGYTGHEQDDEVGLINMKGRLYDPEIGRFISADPHVQAAGDTQSYNRYSYVKNNPLSYTDPSGYFFKKLFKSIGKFFKEWGRTILAVAVTAFIPGIGGAFISSMIASGGDLQQGIVGALSAGVFGFIGSSFGPTARLSIAGRTAKVLAHGVAGGAMSVLRGGKFKEGFVSAGFSQVMEVTGGYRRLGVSSAPRGAAGFAKNAAISAVVGGTASKLVGGKFANGAITGAFSRMFNDLQHHDLRDPESVGDPTPPRHTSEKSPIGVVIDWLSGNHNGRVHFPPGSTFSNMFKEGNGADIFQSYLFEKYGGFPVGGSMDDFGYTFTWYPRAVSTANIAEHVVGSWGNGRAYIDTNKIYFTVENTMGTGSLLFGRQLSELGFGGVGSQASDLHMSITWTVPR